MPNKIKEGLKLVGAGLKFSDKLVISFGIAKGIPFLLVHGAFPHNIKLPGEVTIKSELGTFFCSNNLQYVIQGSPRYEFKIRENFHLEEGIFLDIGANMGKYSILVGKELGDRGRVLAFEPLPKNYEMLKKNITLNNLKNVAALDTACGSENKSSDLFIDSRNTGGHSLVRETDQKIRINVKKLDNIIEDLKLNRIDLIKIDVEGAESDVLKGAVATVKKFRPKIIFESESEENVNFYRSVLGPIGYRIKKIDEHNYYAEANGNKEQTGQESYIP